MNGLSHFGSWLIQVGNWDYILLVNIGSWLIQVGSWNYILLVILCYFGASIICSIVTELERGTAEETLTFVCLFELARAEGAWITTGPAAGIARFLGTTVIVLAGYKLYLIGLSKWEQRRANEEGTS